MPSNVFFNKSVFFVDRGDATTSLLGKIRFMSSTVSSWTPSFIASSGGEEDFGNDAIQSGDW
eukprot:CAMPEP_0203729330 /NCGR_PEP_ID=MMETSP0092-20131115/16524_1 /ASSEMBLY_ACC=CAM_ASM_001090 /TAXON_ID=426623 /ORGANISM="Chaetoceros affinis, Strain CCMP159" /LENGTH=61 /DNA_ID=CAMNT_0050611691 /DNA_START=105 /DNA_END=290 /DNA_ORIENTATION=-